MAVKKFDPDWDLVYLIDDQSYRYMVVKKPEYVPGLEEEKEEVNYDQLYVQEGCVVQADGRWFYFRLPVPMKWEIFKGGHSFLGGRWYDVEDIDQFTPDNIFIKRINEGHSTVGHPAPVFKPRWEGENGWTRYHPIRDAVPHNVTSEMLGDLVLAHMMLSEYLQEGVEDPSKSKKATR
jgi:hypothetical protein